MASARLVWALRRCSSFRSGVWGLFCPYFRLFSALALTCAGFGSGWRSVCCAFGVAFSLGFLTVGFQRGFCTGGFSCFRGPPPAFCGLGNGKVYSKVRPIARGSGDPEPFLCLNKAVLTETHGRGRPNRGRRGRPSPQRQQKKFCAAFPKAVPRPLTRTADTAGPVERPDPLCYAVLRGL